VLTITDRASEAIDAIVASTGEQVDTAGVRITRGVGADGNPGFGIAVASAPEPDDETVESSGEADVFVDPTLTEALEDMVLDARADGNQVGFVLIEREGGETA
jgi:Fe-S cluster assembly iron-binding protein IscA